MTRVRGLSRRQVAAWEDKVSRQVSTSLASVATTTSRLLSVHAVRAAAGVPETPSSGIEGTNPASVSVNDLGVMRQLWLEEVRTQLVPMIADLYTASAHKVTAQIGRAAPPDFDVPVVTSDTAENYLRSATNRLVGIGDELWTHARDGLAEGMTKGESVEQLASRVRQAANVTEPRADVIARTEVNAAANVGSYTYAQLGASAGLGMTKEWLAVLDSRVREDHRIANGQTKPMNEPFIVGGWPMDHPGDFDAPAGEVVNCRCTIVYNVEDNVSGVTAAADGDPLAGLPGVEGVDEPVAGYTAPTGAGDTDVAMPDGDDDTDVDVEPIQKHTGSMVALIPSAADIERLALPGGESPDELHVTLYYLGDGAQYDDAARQQIVSTVQEAILDQHSLSVTGFGVAVWNPLGETPALVMNVGGPGLDEAHECVGECLEELWCVDMPDQHEPWQPHVCLAYAPDPAPLVGDALKRVGPITLDRVRVAFGDQVTDIPLGYTTVQMSLDAGARTMPYEIRHGGGCPPSKPYGVYKKDGGAKIGCHASKADAEAQISAIGISEHSEVDGVALDTQSPAVTGEGDSVGAIGQTNLPGAIPANVSWSTELATLPDGSLAEWEGILVVEGVVTGDGREFAPGSLTWAEPWLPLRWAPADFGEHQGAVNVARIDEIWRDDTDPNIIRGRGYFNVSLPEGLSAYQAVDGQMLRGVSVDVDSVKDTDVEMVFPEDVGDGGDEAQPGPADDDMLSMLFGPPPEKMVFHAGRIRGATLVDLPAFVEAQINTVKAAPMPGGPVMPLPTKSPTASGTGKEPATVDQIVAELGRLLTDATLGVNLAARRARYDRLATTLRTRFQLTAQPFSEDALSDDVKTLLACGATDTYVAPNAWMFEHVVDQPVRASVNIADDGRHIFGYAALWGACHIGHPDVCITAPEEKHHDHYLLGEVLTAEGKRVATGTVTLGTGHAPMHGINARQAVEHYDNTGTAVADIVVGNDEHGIWFAGAIRHGTPAGRVAELRAAKLSGDWRRIGGELRLVALLAVNVPGFGVPRLATRVAHGTQLALVAAGLHEVDEVKRHERDAMRRMKDQIAARIARDPQSKRAALRARIHS